MLHIPVLLKEVLEYLNIKPGGVYIDGTVGLGGHSEEILKSLKYGILIGMDLDKDSLAISFDRLKSSTVKVILEEGNYKDLPLVLEKYGIDSVDGILLDLGFSSFQVSSPHKGFSFLLEGPLDMRFSKNEPLTAERVINKASESKLVEIFTKYGESRAAKKIARKIVERRKSNPIRTTKELAELVTSVIPKKGKIHPATCVFQAIRIYVNKELDNLKGAIPKLIDCLKPRGRICIISYHSLEDRIVKKWFQELEKASKGKRITKKPIVPTREEKKANPRSRSAKLRCFERVD